MKDEIAYMLGIVAVGFAVNYALRALPFLLFAGRARELPKGVERLGRVISPVIILGLIVYSFATLAIGPDKAPAWKTAWPYLAGAATVGLQLWRRNPLASIVTGTVLYMCCIGCGCVSRAAFELDAAHPSVRVSTQGVLMGERYVEHRDVVRALEGHDIPHDRTIHILLDPDVRDLREARSLMNSIAKAGYTRPVLVTRRHAESQAVKREDRAAFGAPRAPAEQPRVRYKRADE